MINKKGPALRLVGSERPPPKERSTPKKEGGNTQVPQPEVVADWEDEGGRVDPARERPESDSPARGT